MEFDSYPPRGPMVDNNNNDNSKHNHNNCFLIIDIITTRSNSVRFLILPMK